MTVEAEPNTPSEEVSRTPRFVRREVALLAFVLSSGLLYASQRASTLWIQIGLVLLGALLLASTLNLAGRLITENRTLWAALLGIGGFALATLGAVWFQMGWIVAPGLLALMVGLVLGYDRIGEKSRPWLLVAGGFVVAVAVLFLSATTVAWRVVGVLLWLIGVVAFKLGVVHSIRAHGPDHTHRRARVAVVAASLGTAVGALVLILVLFDRWRAGPFGWILSASVLFCALSALGLGAVDVWRPTSKRRAGIVSAVAVAVIAGLVAALLVVYYLPQFDTAAFVFLVIPAAIAAFFVLRGEAIAAIALLGLLFVWVLADRTEDPPDPAHESGGVLLALGDSFTSGQGTDRYRTNTNTEADTGNACRRSPVAYAELIGQALDLRVASYACNGADTDDVLGRPSDVPMTEDGSFTPLPTRPGLTVPDGKSQLQNIDSGQGVFADLDDTYDVEDIELVVVSVGGNDAEFSTVVAACLLPSDCAEVKAQWLAEASLIGEQLQLTYEQIIESVPADVPIVVMPYPDYVATNDQCDASISAKERDFAQDYIGAINLAAFTVVSANPRLTWFPGMNDAYDDRRMCSGDAAANLFRFVPKEGNLIERLTPTNWYEATAHPNDLGHRCTAASFLRWLPTSPIGNGEVIDDALPACNLADSDVSIPGLEVEEHPGDEVDQDPGDEDSEAPSADPIIKLGAGKRCAAAPPDPEDPGAEATCFDGDEWTSDQLQDTAKVLIPPVVLSMISGMVGALALVWGWPALRRYRWLALAEALIPQPVDQSS